MQRLTIRELRKNLKKHLDSGQTVAIGDPWQLRGFLVSVTKHDRWDTKAQRRALRAARKAFNDLIRAKLAS